MSGASRTPSSPPPPQSATSATTAIPRLPDIVPSRSTRLVARHRVSAVRFGGGHALYIRDGNAAPDNEWNAVWEALPAADVTRLVEFFEARGGIGVFLWSPPGLAAAQRFVCPEWQVTPEGAGHARLNARFIRMYP